MPEPLTHFIATARVGPKGQIVIPREIREMFGIAPGDALLVMADRERGIAVHKQDVMEGLAKAIFEGRGGDVLPREDPEHLRTFAAAIGGAAAGVSVSVAGGSSAGSSGIDGRGGDGAAAKARGGDRKGKKR